MTPSPKLVAPRPGRQAPSPWSSRAANPASSAPCTCASPAADRAPCATATALVEAEPDKRLTFRSESESFDDAATYVYEFAAVDSERTWLVLRAETSTSGWRSLFAVVAGAIARRGVRRHLDRLRESLEAGPDG